MSAGAYAHWPKHRPQISRRSAPGVITAKSGSQPQYGQWPWRHWEKSTRWVSDSAQRARNGRSDSSST